MFHFSVCSRPHCTSSVNTPLLCTGSHHQPFGDLEFSWDQFRYSGLARDKFPYLRSRHTVIQANIRDSCRQYSIPHTFRNSPYIERLIFFYALLTAATNENLRNFSFCLILFFFDPMTSSSSVLELKIG